MSPKKLQTQQADRRWARDRAAVGQKYFEVATLVDSEDGETINVCIGLAILAGIAAGDAICAVALGERYSGSDHLSAAALLERVDRESGRQLRMLVGMKTNAHYGIALLTPGQRVRALRTAGALLGEAAARLA